MKQKINLSRLFLLTGILILSCSLGLMIAKAFDAEHEKYNFEKRYQLANYFYERSFNYNKIEQLTQQIIDSLRTDKDWNYIEHMQWIDNELIASCFDYLKIKANFIEGMHKNQSDLDCNLNLFITKFHINTAGQKILIYDLERRQSYLSVESEPEITLEKAPDISFYYKGDNYHIQVAASLEFPDLNTYLLKQIKLSILLAILIFVLLTLISAYAYRMLLKQFELNELKDDFIDNMTHELKTPLTTARLALKNLSLKKPELNDDLVILERQNIKLNQTLDRVMGLSLLNVTNPQIQKEETNVHQILNDLYKEFQLRADSLSYDPDDSNLDYTIDADPFYFKILLSNLLENALKYAHGAAIEMKYKLNKHECIVSVKDYGAGIPLRFQKQVFTKFYRVPTGNIHGVKGTGLGLYYVDLIARAHRAKVELISSKEHGTEFKIIFQSNRK